MKKTLNAGLSGAYTSQAPSTKVIALTWALVVWIMNIGCGWSSEWWNDRQVPQWNTTTDYKPTGVEDNWNYVSNTECDENPDQFWSSTLWNMNLKHDIETNPNSVFIIDSNTNICADLWSGLVNIDRNLYMLLDIIENSDHDTLYLTRDINWHMSHLALKYNQESVKSFLEQSNNWQISDSTLRELVQNISWASMNFESSYRQLLDTVVLNVDEVYLPRGFQWDISLSVWSMELWTGLRIETDSWTIVWADFNYDSNGNYSPELQELLNNWNSFLPVTVYLNWERATVSNIAIWRWPEDF